MEEIQFELSNEQRGYLGLIPVEKNWELVALNEMYLYFDGDTIRKKISVSGNSYFEQELNEKTTESRTVLLPKTAKGKPKKLNFTATQSFSPLGIYFRFSGDGYLTIASYTTQTEYYSENLGEGKDLNDLRSWLGQWVAESTENDLKEINAFKTAERKHCPYKEGDFFTFKIGRRAWGFGRILIDIAKRVKKDNLKEGKNYGLTNLMGKALLVKVYHKISDTTEVDLDELSQTLALPSTAIMDNHFYYGEKRIIGHQALRAEEYDMLISYSKSISHGDQSIYLQYGFIYKEADRSEFNKYLIQEDEDVCGGIENPYRNEGIGFSFDTTYLKECIAEKSNLPFWNSDYFDIKCDLRNPANIEIKREIFSFFGLDADKDYEGNLKMIS